MALALNKSAETLASRNKTLENFTYTDKEMAEVFRDSLSKVKFLGFSVSGTMFILIFKATVSYPEEARLIPLSLQLSLEPARVTQCQHILDLYLICHVTCYELSFAKGVWSETAIQ